MSAICDLGELDLDDIETSPESRKLTTRAQSVIARTQDQPIKLPDALLDLLTTVIKPLFSSGHPQITPAGRKPAYAAPPTLPHAVPVSLHEEKPWKIPLTVPLLTWILRSYTSSPQPQRKEVLEAQFPLLIPPILNIIDDISATSKAEGYALLILLCEAIIAAESDILKRTGLIDVFMDAIKSNFMLLPTLTPEDEALLVLQQLYPASLALLRARFDVKYIEKGKSPGKEPTGHKAQIEGEKRQNYLKILLRHGLLAALTHLGAGTSTSYIPLTTFLVMQLGTIIEMMGLSAVAYLQTILPMFRNVLVDPFGTAAPDLLHATLNTMETVIKTCAPRITEKWWPECLRGLVGCWCNIIDDEEDAKKKELLAEVKIRVTEVARVLGSTVSTKDWDDAKFKLMDEAEDLIEMFGE